MVNLRPSRKRLNQYLGINRNPIERRVMQKSLDDSFAVRTIRRNFLFFKKCILLYLHHSVAHRSATCV